MGNAYIRVDPTVPSQGEWSFDATGSPDWGTVLVSGYSGANATSFVSAETAKNFWKTGFRVVNASLSKKF